LHFKKWDQDFVQDIIGMIKKLKNKIKRLVDTRVKLLKNQQRLNEQTHFNYNQISQLFKEESFIPFSAWAMSPSTILHVLNDISINKRKVVIEFGAGASTFYIAKLLKVLKVDAVFYSVESDAIWVSELRRQLEIYNLQDYVKIIHAPLVEIEKDFSYKDQKVWYDIAVLEKVFQDVSKIDLILVDGPFGGSTPFARYSAYPFLQSKLAENISIYLDDIKRPHEREIAESWQNNLNGHLRFIERYAVLTNNRKGFDVTPFQLEDLPL